jgi:hypothetical protein
MEQFLKFIISPQGLITCIGITLTFIMAVLQLRKSRGIDARGGNITAKKHGTRRKNNDIDISLDFKIRFKKSG